MYIINSDKIDTDKIISVNKKIGKYLINKGFPLMSNDIDGNFLFNKTESIELVLKNIPFWLKLLNKIEGR